MAYKNTPPVRTLLLKGHVHGREKQSEVSSYTWPLGKKLKDVLEIVDAYSKAFVLKSAEIVFESR